MLGATTSMTEGIAISQPDNHPVFFFLKGALNAPFYRQVIGYLTHCGRGLNHQYCY